MRQQRRLALPRREPDDHEGILGRDLEMDVTGIVETREVVALDAGEARRQRRGGADADRIAHARFPVRNDLGIRQVLDLRRRQLQRQPRSEALARLDAGDDHLVALLAAQPEVHGRAHLRHGGDRQEPQEPGGAFDAGHGGDLGGAGAVFGVLVDPVTQPVGAAGLHGHRRVELDERALDPAHPGRDLRAAQHVMRDQHQVAARGGARSPVLEAGEGVGAVERLVHPPAGLDPDLVGMRLARVRHRLGQRDRPRVIRPADDPLGLRPVVGLVVEPDPHRMRRVEVVAAPAEVRAGARREMVDGLVAPAIDDHRPADAVVARCRPPGAGDRLQHLAQRLALLVDAIVAQPLRGAEGVPVLQGLPVDLGVGGRIGIAGPLQRGNERRGRVARQPLHPRLAIPVVGMALHDAVESVELAVQLVGRPDADRGQRQRLVEVQRILGPDRLQRRQHDLVEVAPVRALLRHPGDLDLPAPARGQLPGELAKERIGSLRHQPQRRHLLPLVRVRQPLADAHVDAQALLPVALPVEPVEPRREPKDHRAPPREPRRPGRWCGRVPAGGSAPPPRRARAAGCAPPRSDRSGGHAPLCSRPC